MSFPKLLIFVSIALFTLIGALALLKGGKPQNERIPLSPLATPIEINLNKLRPAPAKTTTVPFAPGAEIVLPVSSPLAIEKKPLAEKSPESVLVNAHGPAQEEPPEVNRVQELFNKGDPKFPFVETITYKSRVSWQKGRPAWLSDYASHYSTSRHFIARSLNGKPDYFKQDVAEGDRFNVLRQDLNLNFHLLIDLARSKLWLYAIDGDSNNRWLIKTYRVGLGRADKSKPSCLLTPLGKYSLGNKIAIYKPKMQGYYNGQKTEMIRVFGTRWIPFDRELSGCTAPAKGFGIHGVPWILNAKGELVQDTNSLGKYESDGCVRLATEDMEEIFAIVITRPANIELVKDYYDASLPGVEKP